MSAETHGDKGQPHFDALGAPAIDVDPSSVADYAALVGNRISDTQANRLANVFPNASGKPITDGIEWYETDTGDTYLRDQGSWAFQTARSTVALPTPSTNWSIVTGTKTVHRFDMIFFHWVFTKNQAITLTNELIMVLPGPLRPLDTVWVPAVVVTGGSEAPSMLTISTDGGVRVPFVPSSGARSFKADSHYFIS